MDFGCQRAKMPLSKMPRRVALLLKQFGQADFFGLEVSTVGKINAVSKWVSPRQAATASWAADRRGRIPPVKLQAGTGHAIEVRGFQKWMAVEADILPALVVGHAENDVGAIGFLGRWIFSDEPARADFIAA